VYVLQQFKRAELHSIVVTVVVVSLVVRTHMRVCVSLFASSNPSVPSPLKP
jgi:hypothetical protein